MKEQLLPGVQLNAKLSSLKMSVRASNCLCRANIETLVDLAKMTRRQVLRIKHIGRKTANELERLLNKYGLEFSKQEICPHCGKAHDCRERN